jgi:hypothetical protein
VNVLSKAGSAVKRLRLGMKAASMVFNRAQSASFYPHEPKKSGIRIAFELFRDAFHAAEIDDAYFLYGRDTIRVGSRRFPTMGALMNIVHRQVKEHGVEQAALLNDKTRFAAFLENAGFPTPPILGRTEGGRVVSADGAHLHLDELLVSASGRLFLKPVNGSAGRGVIRVVSSEGTLFASNRPVAREDLPRLLGSGLLVQKVVEQHPRMEQLHAASLNTVRFVTALARGRAQVIGSFLRLGTGGAMTDNFSGSGIAVPIEHETGKLVSPGFFREGIRGRPTAHPDSGVSFDDFELPFYQDACELTCRVHERLGGLVTVGWDVALTLDGPTIMEGNVFWMPRMHIAGDPTFLSRYAAIVSPWLQDRDRIWAPVN